MQTPWLRARGACWGVSVWPVHICLASAHLSCCFLLGPICLGSSSAAAQVGGRARLVLHRGEQRKGGISSASKGLRLQGEEVSRATSCWLRLVTGKMFPNNPSVWVSAQPITNFPACSPGGTSLSLGVVHAIGWPHPSRTFSFPGQTHVPFLYFYILLRKAQTPSLVSPWTFWPLIASILPRQKQRLTLHGASPVCPACLVCPSPAYVLPPRASPAVAGRFHREMLLSPQLPAW